jgi:hypothetical protein
LAQHRREPPLIRAIQVVIYGGGGGSEPNLVNSASAALNVEEEGLERGEETATANNPQSKNAAYQAGFCIDGCGRKPSAGRPRCTECHRGYVNTNAGYEQ